LNVALKRLGGLDIVHSTVHDMRRAWHSNSHNASSTGSPGFNRPATHLIHRVRLDR
jgi:hypothetical protein